MGHHRYDFEDEQDRLNQSTDGDELDEWFSKYSLLGNERERAQKLAEAEQKRDAEAARAAADRAFDALRAVGTCRSCSSTKAWMHDMMRAM